MLYTVGALTTILISLFGLTWFHVDVDLAKAVAGSEALGMSGRMDVGLRSISVCTKLAPATCVTLDLSNFNGAYPTMATATFWASLALIGVVIVQTALRVLTHEAPAQLTRIGCVVAVACFVTGGLAGYLFAPESGATNALASTVHRTWSPALAMIGYGLAIQALRHAIAEHASAPAIPPAVVRAMPAPAPARPQVRALADEPVVARPRVDSIPLSVSVSDEPDSAVHDPFAPPPERAPARVTAAPPLAAAPPAATPRPRGLLQYATTRIVIGDAGLDGELQDGTSRRAAWADLVGVIARRLPAAAPYDGETIIDIVSTAGATLRLTPASAIDGELFTATGADRARSFVQLLAERCPGAKLDGATRAFLAGGDALQFPDADVLAQHDARVG